jgi:NADH-quinone oxidoreductase subunit L
MQANFPLFLIALLPLLGAAFSLIFGKRAGKNAVTLVACGAVGASLLVSIRAVVLMATELPPGGVMVDAFFAEPWIKAGDLTISAGLILDHLSAVMILIVTGIGFLIHVYSTAYMEHDEGYTRFFGYLNLFMGSMLILVLGDSLPVTFVGWEGVGLCSYLLIGFWYDKDANASAGRKAFVVNRIGDFGFLLGMFLLFNTTGTLKYTELAGKTEALHTLLWLSQPAALFISLLILLGATGKSAQIPLYVWLPDAMAGPTPVSALIHAATMVTAGVYVVTRMHIVFEAAPQSLAVVAIVGALTALFAATIGIAQRDLKKVLAYSTISQLGFMFAAVGSFLQPMSSNYQAGIFHLATHAFFKAGLFLGAGSVMHALSGEGDITRMGGLKKWLPHTRYTFLIYCLSIAGIPPFAGFWSKDAILSGALAAQWKAAENASAAELFFAHHLGAVLYALLLAAAACTAFYMFRLYFLVFEGEFRGTEEQRHHIHESPPAMTVVLWLLAIGSLVVGFSGIPDVIHEGWDHFADWLSPVVGAQAREESLHEFVVAAAIASTVSALSIGIAWSFYKNGFSPAVKKIVSTVPRLYKLVVNKYYIDELYNGTVVRFLRGTAVVSWKFIDTFVIDLVLVNGVGFLVGGIGKLVKYLQNGDVQRYVVGILAGTAGLLYVATNYAACSASNFQLSAEGHDVTVTAKSSSGDDKRLQFRVAWERSGDFSEKQGSPTFHHTYDSGGKKKITVEVTDPRWGTVVSETKSVTLP